MLKKLLLLENCLGMITIGVFVSCCFQFLIQIKIDICSKVCNTSQKREHRLNISILTTDVLTRQIKQVCFIIVINFLTFFNSPITCHQRVGTNEISIQYCSHCGMTIYLSQKGGCGHLISSQGIQKDTMKW